jgi:hypothetical protein
MSNNSLEIKTNEQPIQQVMPFKSIDRYCNLQKKNGLTRMNGCFKALPLSKKYDNYNNSNNNSNNNINNNSNNNSNNNDAETINCRSLRNKMKYAEYVRIHGITEKSSSSVKQTCRFGATYRY